MRNVSALRAVAGSLPERRTVLLAAISLFHLRR
jgi:hypothetical protein